MKDTVEDLLDAIAATALRIPKAVARIDGPVVFLNEAGSKPPIYWCFTNWAEPVMLANRLGPDQPLVAMRSLFQLIEGKASKRAHTADLGAAYADLVLARSDGRPLIVGGNCQAAPISEAVAHNLLGRTGRAPLLVTLEHVPTYCYPGSLVMLFGRASEGFNPFLHGGDPRPAWAAMHGQASWGFIDAAHGAYFMEPAVHVLVGYLRRVSAEFCLSATVNPGEIQLIPEATAT